MRSFKLGKTKMRFFKAIRAKGVFSPKNVGRGFFISF